jgi:hypothetical protein
MDSGKNEEFFETLVGLDEIYMGRKLRVGADLGNM